MDALLYGQSGELNTRDLAPPVTALTLKGGDRKIDGGSRGVVAALQIDAVLVTPSCCDPLCRRGLAVSMGTLFQVPWARIGDKPPDWSQPGIGRLRAMGFQTVAMALSDEAMDIDDPKLMAVEKLAIMLGTEDSGLSHRTIAECDYTARISMSHKVDSLNVAAASAVAFWQLRVR